MFLHKISEEKIQQLIDWGNKSIGIELGTDYDFRYAVFTPQEEMKQILRDSTRRLETIRRAFGVEDYKTASENAKILSSALKTQMAVFEERYSKLGEDTDEFKQMKTLHKDLEK